MRSSKFLQQYKETEKERSRLADALHEQQLNATLEFERQHEQHLKELAKHMDPLLQHFNQFMQEANARVTILNLSCELIKAKLKQEVQEARCEMVALQTKYEKREERVLALVIKQR